VTGWRSLGVAAGLALGSALGSLAGGFGWFLAQVRHPAPPETSAADGIVALTGGADRVGTALRLLASGRARVLLVSGVGGAADLAALGRRAGLRPADVASLRDRVTLGRAAASTHGNAVETAAWAREHAVDSLLVVTADYHMPRAMAELSRALPDMRLYAMPVRDPLAAPWPLLAGEYAKFLAVEAGLPAWREPLVAPVGDDRGHAGE